MPDDGTPTPDSKVVLDPRKQDAGSPVFRLMAFALMLAFLTVLSYLSASNFDQSEIKLIGGMAVVTLLVLFAPELARRFLGGKSPE